MFGKITRRPADILWSQYLRKLRNYTCEFPNCGKKHEENSKNLGISHFWGRAKESTRFDGENLDIFCNIPCHEYFTTHRTEYEVWKEKQLGSKRYKMLTVRAHTYQKKDDKKMLIALKILLNENLQKNI